MMWIRTLEQKSDPMTAAFDPNQLDTIRAKPTIAPQKISGENLEARAGIGQSRLEFGGGYPDSLHSRQFKTCSKSIQRHGHFICPACGVVLHRGCWP
ncbi:MAG: hypothetical protein ACI9VS_002326 [Candidatus Binatia bacterium]|jgi:hypothetical protein